MGKYILIGIFLAQVFSTAVFAAQDYAYSIKFDWPKVKTPALVKIDIENDAIIRETKCHRMHNNLSIDANGDVFVTRYKDVDFLGQQIDKYIAKDNKIIKVAETYGMGPLTVVPYQDRLFVLMYCRGDAYGKRRAASIEVLKKAGKNKYEFEKELILGTGTNTFSHQMDVDFNSKKIYVLAYRVLPAEEQYRSFIYEIDLETASISREADLEVPGGVSGLAISRDRKIYISATYWSYGMYRPKNDNIFVYSIDNFKLIRKIKTHILAKDLVYVADVDKLYVTYGAFGPHEPYIEVIDCKKDKVIGKIAVKHIKKLNYIGNNKLYVSSPGIGIYVIDVEQDKIIKTIPGQFSPISFDFSALK
ncbi:MAG: hypothetical protein KKB81_02990 [Candidatus Margulisbacteria bacterium]|nr:hypothetical protein [Candidatus Margulisiibacteriota bacterium]MBU1022210.1 hypothetical protein [Candidatus Margulisiibacteriota bacterium]MBU1729351.1 hypothetical protein [Candidatus Margulisiibacteriota bacterium]MBU1955624.1 hypothetical protein [Candidatus Margulisiibacteriota bacterium]